MSTIQEKSVGINCSLVADIFPSTHNLCVPSGKEDPLKVEAIEVHEDGNIAPPQFALNVVTYLYSVTPSPPTVTEIFLFFV